VKLLRLFTVSPHLRQYSLKYFGNNKYGLGPYEIGYYSKKDYYIYIGDHNIFNISTYYYTYDTMRIYRYPQYGLSLEYLIDDKGRSLTEISRECDNVKIIYDNKYRKFIFYDIMITLWNDKFLIEINSKIIIYRNGIMGLDPVRDINRVGLIINNNKITIYYPNGNKAAKLEYKSIHASRLKSATFYDIYGDKICKF
jgi:hypothetical protein